MDSRDSKPAPVAEGLIQRIAAKTTWPDLGLPASQQDAVRSIATDARRLPSTGDTRAREGGSSAGLTALFVGPDRTGATRAAEVLARELDRDLYRVDLSRVASKYIGETEKNLNRVFESAEAARSVLLFDEADALFGKRTDVKDSHDRYANIEINYLLDRLEAYGGLAILATNSKSSVDDAFIRRLRYVVDFPRR